MDSKRKIVSAPSCAEITEKKSRFIAVCFGISGEQEALSLIAAQKKRYFDARHTCFAYVCGENDEISRFSDDGEPHGTAGKPILDVISGNGLKNTLITVTRYFGGTLLGTGGLVRAYSSSAAAAVKNGMENGSILETARGAVLKAVVPYKDLGRFEYLCRTKDVQIDGKEFAENVIFTLLVREETIEAFESEAAGLAGGKMKITKGEIADYVFKAAAG